MDFEQYVKDNTLKISGGWKIVSVDIKELVRYLKSHPGITELSLQCIKIDYEDIGKLAKLAHLTSLDLCSSYIGTEGAKALASGNLTNLTSLCLSKSGIDDEGVKELANGNLSNLTSLDLSSREKISEEERMERALNPFDRYCNRISDKGAKALANGNLSSLISLDLRNIQPLWIEIHRLRESIEC